MIEIEARAREYIISSGGIIHLYDYGNIKMCCGQMNPGPSVRLGKPPAKLKYMASEIDGVTVYVPQDFGNREGLKVCLRRFLCWSDLYVEGWKLL